MERNEAIRKLQELVGKELHELAQQYGVTIYRNGKVNKGWAGHVFERHLQLPINSAQSPNFGSWELKSIPLKYKKNGELTFKETMAITMIDPFNVKNTPFEESHLLSKMKKILLLSRIWEGSNEPSSIVYGVHTFDIGNKQIYEQIKEDYELVRKTIQEKGFEALSGKMGVYIQPRTKGVGHGSTTRAFYARVPFLKKIILLEE